MRTLTNILKCYLTRNVVLHFNAKKESEKRPNKKSKVSGAHNEDNLFEE